MAIEKRTTKTGETRYLVRIFRGLDTRGKRREAHRTFQLLKDAKRWETAQKRALDTGTYCEPTSETLGAYMRAWVQTAPQMRVRAKTLQDYTRIIERDILADPVAAIPLGRVTTRALEMYYARLGARGLGPRSVRYVHGLIHAALKIAVRDRLLPFNPAGEATLPKQEAARTHALTATEVQHLLAVSEASSQESLTSKHHRRCWHALWHLLAHGGLRPSEALALRWDDVETDRVQVRASLVKGVKGDPWRIEPPKTAKSRRAVTLPQTTMDALARHRAKQDLEKLVAGTRYQDLGFVFATEDGSPGDLKNITRRHFYPLLQRAKLPKIRMYDLRHTHATLMLSAGVPVKVVSDRLGHASATMTLNVYAHVLTGQQEDAVRAFQSYLALAATTSS